MRHIASIPNSISYVVIVLKAITLNRTQTELTRGFILLLPQGAVFPGLDALGSDGVEPASSFVI